MAARKKKPDDETSSEVKETLPEETSKSEDGGEKKKKKAPKADVFAALTAAMEKKWPGHTSLASELPLQKVPRASTGNFGLDIATEGGVPRGRISRFFGPPKSAKTGSAFNLVAEWQKHCSVCFARTECACEDRLPAFVHWVDAEGRSSDNMIWMLAHGIDLSRCYIQKPQSGEEAVDAADISLRSGENVLVIIDSVANIVSSAEINKATEDGGVMGRNAMLMNSALRKWQISLNSVGINSKKLPTLLLLNQLRSNVGGYGPADVQPGGRGMEFSTSLDIKFTRRASHFLVNEGTDESPKWVDKQGGGGEKGYKPKGDETPAYVEVEYSVTSGNVGAVGRSGVFNYWLKNVNGHHPGDPDNEDRLWDYARSEGLLVKTGATYTLKTLEGKTQDSIREQLMADKSLQHQLWAEIIALKTKS